MGYYGIEFNYYLPVTCGSYGYPSDEKFKGDMVYSSGSAIRKHDGILETKIDATEGQSGSPVFVNEGYAIGILNSGTDTITYVRQLNSELVDWLEQNHYYD